MLQQSKSLLVAVAAIIAVEVVGRMIRLPIAAATGLAATVAAVVYTAIHDREDR